VETTRDLVATSAELAAGVQHGQHDLGRRHLGVLHRRIDGDATAVVANLATAVWLEPDLDRAGVAGHGFVDGVVDDLVDHVVQAGGTRRPDVHAGSLPNRLESLEDLDRLSAVRRGFC